VCILFLSKCLNKIGEAYTEKCVGHRGYTGPKNWHSRQLRNKKVEVDEGFNARRSQHRSIRISENEVPTITVYLNMIMVSNSRVRV